jgi:hypothetical protein
VNATKAFLRKGTKARWIPTKITLDAYAASHRPNGSGSLEVKPLAGPGKTSLL